MTSILDYREIEQSIFKASYDYIHELFKNKDELDAYYCFNTREKIFRDIMDHEFENNQCSVDNDIVYMFHYEIKKDRDFEIEKIFKVWYLLWEER